MVISTAAAALVLERAKQQVSGQWQQHEDKTAA